MPVIPVQSIGWSFLATSGLTLTNFSSTDDVVYTSDRVPYGHIGKVTDFGIIFNTAGGSVYITRVMSSGSEIRITGNISATATGLGSITLNEGEKLRCRIGSTGSGVISLYDDGYLEDKVQARDMFPNIVGTDITRRGGF